MQIEANNYTIAVLGAGTMGEGIAQIAGTAGHPVLLYDVSQEQTQSAIENIAGRLQHSVNKEKITDKKRTQILANIKPVQILEELAKAKLAIEAIIEDLLIKQDVFSQLESLLEEDAILATNTSSIDLNEIGSVLKRPERLVGMYFLILLRQWRWWKLCNPLKRIQRLQIWFFHSQNIGGKARYMSAPVRDSLSTALPALFTVKLWLFSKKVELMRQPVMP